jgi:anti-sigma factor RsiW
MKSEFPFEGDVPSDGDEPSYEWLDEWLCEYVDGTMDPSLEAVFEQYVEANPDLKAHVERLQKTRDLLCNCGLPKEPPADVEAEVCREVECDMPQPSAPPPDDPARPHPLSALGLVSSVAAALVVGFLVGATLVTPASSPLRGATPPSQEAPEASPASSPKPTQATPTERPDLFLRRPAAPVPAADSARYQAPLTTVGTP